MARTRVAGELYEHLTGQLFEIGRQLRQPNGYPFDPELLKMHLQAAIEGRFGNVASAPKIGTQFTIAVSEGETFESLIRAGKYDWKNDLITAERLPVRRSEPGERKLVILHFGRDISSEDAIKKAAKKGLECPTYEDCLRFGAQHPEVQRQFSIVFLHEPVRDDGVAPIVLCLSRRDSGRSLNYGWFAYDWSDLYRFAFVRPPTVKP